MFDVLHIVTTFLSSSTHKMELREEVYCANENLQATEMAFKNQKEALINTSSHLTEAHIELASNLDKLSDIFINFDKMVSSIYLQ